MCNVGQRLTIGRLETEALRDRKALANGDAAGETGPDDRRTATPLHEEVKLTVFELNVHTPYEVTANGANSSSNSAMSPRSWAMVFSSSAGPSSYRFA